MIGSLDPEEWGAAWMTIGDRHFERASGRTPRGKKAAQQGFLAAWRLYTLGRWPVASSPKKLQCYERAKQAFAAYGQCVDPKIETIRIPFEGKEIVAFLQKPPASPGRRSSSASAAAISGRTPSRSKAAPSSHGALR